MTKKKKAANNNGMTAGSSVGYGNPPKHAQFQKGKSGNPKGRPKGSKNQNLGALIQSTFDHKLTTSVNGKPTKMSLIQALITKLAATALGGNHAAMKLAFDLYDGAHPPMNDNSSLTTGSSFELTPEDLAAIAKSTLLKGIK